MLTQSFLRAHSRTYSRTTTIKKLKRKIKTNKSKRYKKFLGEARRTSDGEAESAIHDHLHLIKLLTLARTHSLRREHPLRHHGRRPRWLCLPKSPDSLASLLMIPPPHSQSRDRL